MSESNPEYNTNPNHQTSRELGLPGFLQFFQQWIKTHYPTLLILLLGLYLPLAIFLFLAVQIWRLEGGLSWDIAIMTAIHAAATPQLDRIATILTQFGTHWGVIPFSVVFSLGLLYQRRWRSLTYFLITMVGCGLINNSAKLLLHRVRPSLWDYPALPTFSFPSGHAMSSMMLIMALLVLTWGGRWSKWVTALGTLFVIAIAWTRLYLGVHYPSDILAGWMLAIAWAIGVSLVVRPRFSLLKNNAAERIEGKREEEINYTRSE
jgi:membrane-associated phospholipid phosphatase